MPRQCQCDADGAAADCGALKALDTSAFNDLVETTTEASVILCRGVVSRVPHKWAHPGGDFLHHFHGKDCTEHFDTAHATDTQAKRILRRFAVGRLEAEKADALVPPEDRELRALARRYEAEGRFARSTWRGFAKLLEPACLVSCGFLMRHLGFPAWSQWLLHIIGLLRLFWWMHDVMHHAVLPDGRLADMAVDLIMFLSFGLFGAIDLRQHSVHHVFANVLDHDWRQLGPFQIDGRHSSNSGRWFVRIQAPLWFLVALPLSGILKFCSRVSKSGLLKMILCLLRLAALSYIDWTLVVLPLPTISLAMYISSWNHFHMVKVGDVAERPDSFVKAMATCSCNWRGGPIFSWLCGGLDLHIEHHLFPTLPHTELKAVSSDVQALLRKHHVPYTSVPLLTVVLENARHIMDPYRATTPEAFSQASPVSPCAKDGDIRLTIKEEDASTLSPISSPANSEASDSM